MRTQILVSIDRDGLRDISLVAESENECKEVLETYQKYESEILGFLCAMRKKNASESLRL